MSTAVTNLPDLAHLPADLLAKASEVPGLPERLLRFIRLEVAMNERRQQRHSPEALALVQRARERVAGRKAHGIDRETVMKEFHENYEAILKEL
jgi:hypothetical protein